MYVLLLRREEKKKLNKNKNTQSAVIKIDPHNTTINTNS